MRRRGLAFKTASEIAVPTTRVYYKMNSNADDFYNNVDGVLNVVNWSAGINSAAAHFNTTYGRIDVPHNDIFNFRDGAANSKFCMSGWLKFDSFSSTGNWIINKRGATSATDEWQLTAGYPSQNIGFTKFGGGVYQTWVGSTVLALNTWYFIALSSDALGTLSSVKIWINAVEETLTTSGETSMIIQSGTHDVVIGRASWALTANHLRHRGLLDEFELIKGQEYTQGQVDTLYNGGVGVTP